MMTRKFLRKCHVMRNPFVSFAFLLVRTLRTQLVVLTPFITDTIVDQYRTLQHPQKHKGGPSSTRIGLRIIYRLISGNDQYCIVTEIWILSYRSYSLLYKRDYYKNNFSFNLIDSAWWCKKKKNKMQTQLDVEIATIYVNRSSK